jgi:hypothetical protein
MSNSTALILVIAAGPGTPITSGYAPLIFNIRKDDVTEDFEGKELADYAAAHAYAKIAARSLAPDTDAHGHLGLSHRIEIVSEACELVGTVTFAEAVEIRSYRAPAQIVRGFAPMPLRPSERPSTPARLRS